MIDKSGFKLNRVISPETRYIHFMEAIQEVELRFLNIKEQKFRSIKHVSEYFKNKVN